MLISKIISGGQTGVDRGNMPAVRANLGFAKPADALGFFSNIQQQLYAA